MKTYKDYVVTAGAVYMVIQNFRQFGIILERDGAISYDWQTIPYINKAVAENSLNLGLPMQSALALQLACAEEERNGHIHDYEIESVNKFFNVNITRNLISKFHSKYI